MNTLKGLAIWAWFVPLGRGIHAGQMWSAYLYHDHYWYDGHLGALLALVMHPYLQMAFTVWLIPLAVVAILLLHKN